MMARSTGEIARNWPIILAAGVGIGVGLTGLPNYTFGTFIKPLSAEFGWTRSQVALGTLFLHSGTFFTSPFVGGFVDRFGARRLALLSLVGLAIGLMCVAASGPSLASFYGAWILLALLGCATTPLTWTRMINLHFDRSLGMALGLALMGTGVASLLGPRLCAWLIADYGWRGAYAALAALVLLVALPIATLGSMKRFNTERPAVAASGGGGLTLRQAVTTRRFWIIAAGIALVIFGQGGATVHLVPMLTDRGFSSTAAASLAGMLGIGVIVGRVVVGMLLDRWPAPRVAACFLPLPAVAFILLATSGTISAAVVATLLLGLAAGAEVDLLAFLTRRYFGTRHYGRIYGVNLSIFALSAGLGPAATGWSFDRTGSYQLALWLGVGIFAAGATLISRLGVYPVFEDEPRPLARRA